MSDDHPQARALAQHDQICCDAPSRPCSRVSPARPSAACDVDHTPEWPQRLAYIRAVSPSSCVRAQSHPQMYARASKKIQVTDHMLAQACTHKLKSNSAKCGCCGRHILKVGVGVVSEEQSNHRRPAPATRPHQSYVLCECVVLMNKYMKTNVNKNMYTVHMCYMLAYTGYACATSVSCLA